MDKRGENSKLSPRHEDLINLVGMLFEYILDDHILPENIRKSISLLQIPVLRTAILDHDFLTERDHPARILLNEMTSAGMECQENCFTDPIYLLIDSIVNIIITQSYENPDIFKDCLERFRVELGIINFDESDQAKNLEDEAILEPHENITLREDDGSSENKNIEKSLLDEADFDEC